MKKILVTGASKGIGKAIAKELASQGHEIFATYNSDRDGAEDLMKSVLKSNGKISIYKLDVCDESSIAELYDEISKKVEELDVLVNNAGIDFDIPIQEYPTDKIKKVIEVNLLGPIFVTQVFLPLLKNSQNNPVIINISSRMGIKDLVEGVGAYAPSKAGLIRFTQCCTYEFAQYGIRANAVCPGFTRTNVYETLFPQPGQLDELFNAVSSDNPCGRICKIEDTANLVAFLVSNKATYINGEAIVVDGGGNLV